MEKPGHWMRHSFFNTFWEIIKLSIFAQLSLGMWSIITTFSRERVKSRAGTFPKDRTETWGQAGFSSSKCQEVWHQSSAFPTVQRPHPEERSTCRYVVPWEDANLLPPNSALDWLESPKFQLTPKLPMPRVPQGPTTTALPPILCIQSSNCQFLFQLFSAQRARAELTVNLIFLSFLIYRLSNCIWSRQREETNNTAEHLGTLIANYS